ncbi:SAM-dependent methyltransferase [Streptosporangium carneum]|uniref:SAM-dependent methyltransferase n=1 Tax=Streptosporangium carneum TaxID=47481 RepID=A0A9W6MFM8_9ACTN|nr:SAM-dependent methyltransferase [Streptosporangium carneum]GLK12043.1 hypothetical protein GCM10017600_54510 [Streptosporangium carneum]
MSDGNRSLTPNLGMGHPHPARIYDYLLGGKDNFAPDRQAAEQGLAAAPDVRDIALANRRFLVRVVRHLAGLGVRQFLDVGTGFPTSPNVHEIAGEASAVVYVDVDPVVVTHGRAQLAKRHNVHMIQGDLREPADVLAQGGRLLDLREPVALLVVSVTHNVTDEEGPAGILARYMRELASGSHLAISQMASDVSPERSAALAGVAARQRMTLLPRTHAEVLAQFGGLPLLEPGLVQVPLWHPDEEERAARAQLSRVWTYGGVARKE